MDSLSSMFADSEASEIQTPHLSKVVHALRKHAHIPHWNIRLQDDQHKPLTRPEPHSTSGTHDTMILKAWKEILTDCGLDPEHETEKHVYEYWELFYHMNSCMEKLYTVDDEGKKTQTLHMVEGVELETFTKHCKRFGPAFLAAGHSQNEVTPYIHVLVEHAPDLMKMHGNLAQFSNQGFEAAHKYHKSLWLMTSRGGGKHKKSSILQMFELFYIQKHLIVLQNAHEIHS